MKAARPNAGRRSKELTVKELLEKLQAFGEQRMLGHWDGFHLELFSDGSGAIKYRWVDHPFSKDNEIAFQSIDELKALLG